MAESTSSESKPMSFADILRILPHRYPFLLVDKVLECHDGDKAGSRVGRRVRAVKNVTINEPFFTGHFPDNPVMPGVLQIEAMAQAGALACFRLSDPPMDVAIANVREARFRRPVVPGDSLEIHAEVKKDRGQMVLICGQVYVEGQLVAEAEFLAHFSPKAHKDEGSQGAHS